MAYTYDDFTSAANAAGLMKQFSTQDLQVAQTNPEFGMSLLSLLKDNSMASTEEQRLLATEAANQLRKNYGIYNTGSLGTDSSYASSYGSQIGSLMDDVSNYGSFKYDNEDAYRELLSSVASQQPFSYDLDSDPTWSSYKKAYMREGERASANALAQAAAASGGQVSSFAQTAANQAGNYYTAQLADMIPTLQQNAYSQYQSDFSQLMNQLSAVQSDRQIDYDEWMDQYNMLQNSLANYQNQDATDYQRYIDAANQKYTQDQAAYENALALYQTLGYATPEVAKILGISTGSGTTGTSTASSGKSTSSGSTSSKSATTSGISADVLAALKSSYPNGKITNKSYWDSLVALYGEAALKAAGYSYGSSGSASSSSKTGSTSSGSSGSNSGGKKNLTHAMVLG